MVYAHFKVKLRTKNLVEHEKVPQSAYNIAKRAQEVKIQPDHTQICEMFVFCFEAFPTTTVWLSDQQSKTKIGPESDKKGQDVHNTERLTCVFI